MTAAQDSVTQSVFTVQNPRTNDVVGSYPVHGAEEVADLVARARTTATWWSQRSFRERRAVLLAAKKTMVHELAGVAAVIASETGKPDSDARLETILTIDYLDWAAKNAERVLRTRKVRPGSLGINQRAWVRYEPFGVVGVIGPWNYPLWTPMGSITFALAAGNTVVFKPSELTVGVAMKVAEIVNSAAGKPILQIATGFGETGAALIDAKVDKVAFTGSSGTAKSIMAQCAKHLTPVTIEAGGKDALLVAADADLDLAANAAVFGALGNAGQTCAGVERIYVVEAVRDAFTDRVLALIDQLKIGNFPDSAYGPMTLDRQPGIVRGQIEDALAHGATALRGGVESVGERFIQPVVLRDVPADSTAMREETFGPTVVINTVKNLDEAVEQANAGPYGLSGSIFTKNTGLGRELAARFRSGAVTINSVIGFAAIPALPFGGVGDSGFGRVHGDEGLREFSRSKTVTEQRFPPPIDLMSMRRTDRALRISERMIRLLHGR